MPHWRKRGSDHKAFQAARQGGFALTPNHSFQRTAFGGRWNEWLGRFKNPRCIANLSCGIRRTAHRL
jgi:hypothetical protein